MLRLAIITGFGLGLIGCLAAALTGAIQLWGPAIWLAIGLVLVLLEGRSYKPPAADVPPPPWQETAERFIDLETGERVRVFFDPDTGDRRYVADN